MVWFGVVDRVTYRGLVISADQTLDDPETRFQCGEVTTLESRDPIFQMTKCNLGTPGFFVGFPPPPRHYADRTPGASNWKGCCTDRRCRWEKKTGEGNVHVSSFLAVHFVGTFGSALQIHCESTHGQAERENGQSFVYTPNVLAPAKPTYTQ